MRHHKTFHHLRGLTNWVGFKLENENETLFSVFHLNCSHQFKIEVVFYDFFLECDVWRKSPCFLVINFNFLIQMQSHKFHFSHINFMNWMEDRVTANGTSHTHLMNIKTVQLDRLSPSLAYSMRIDPRWWKTLRHRLLIIADKSSPSELSRSRFFMKMGKMLWLKLGGITNFKEKTFSISSLSHFLFIFMLGRCRPVTQST